MYAKEEWHQFDKHLILYFDINDTMYIGDSAKGINKETAILKLLAEHYVSIWDPTITPVVMSYKHFVEQYVCPGNKREAAVQQAQIIQYNGFITFLESKRHGLTEKIKNEYLKIKSNLKNGNIPQSFINLIHYLEKNKFRYSLVFRTFGKDIEEVGKELAERTPISTLPHAVFESGNLKLADGRVLTTPAQMMAYFKSLKHSSCRDSFSDWRQTGEAHVGGKPHILDFNSNDIAIFFDDNALKEILCIKSTQGDHFEQRLIQDELIKLGRIVPVNTYGVCSDNDYFIKTVEFACQTSLQLSHYLPLSEHGVTQLDEAIFCWALKELNPGAPLEIAKKCFADLLEAYQDSERYFHRGLGHPRSLLPTLSQFIYKSALVQKSSLNLPQLLEQFNAQFLVKIPNPSERIREAQEVIAGFYHDVVHRKGKKPKSLEKYKRGDHYSTIEGSTPHTRSLLDSDKADKPEELSCLMVEDALNKIIPPTSLLPIILAILSTIPFSKISRPEHLTNCIKKALDSNKLSLSAHSVHTAVNVALAVTNRDHGSYAEDSLDEFNKKSWAMMLERNVNLVNPNHFLSDEAETIADFYEIHKKLYKEMVSGITPIYHTQDNIPETIKLNNKAKETLRLDIILQGIQLAAMAIRIAICSRKAVQNINPINSIENNNDVAIFMQAYENNSSLNHLPEVPNAVVSVLQEHGKECSVNGILITRGTNNAGFALRLVKLFGIEKMLAIADNYKSFTTPHLHDLFKSLSVVEKPSLKPSFFKSVADKDTVQSQDKMRLTNQSLL